MGVAEGGSKKVREERGLGSEEGGVGGGILEKLRSEIGGRWRVRWKFRVGEEGGFMEWLGRGS